MSRPDQPPSDSHAPDDGVGADLLAHLLGQLEPARADELERRLAASVELREERDRLAADLATYRGAGAAPTAPPGGLAALLAQVEDEAAERRADHAVANSRLSADLGATVVAHALGQLRGRSADDAEQIIATNPDASAEVTLVERLVAATRRQRSTVTLTP